MTEHEATVVEEHVPEDVKCPPVLVTYDGEFFDAECLPDKKRQKDALRFAQNRRHWLLRVTPPVERRVVIDWDAVSAANPGGMTDEQYQALVERHATIKETAR